MKYFLSLSSTTKSLMACTVFSILGIVGFYLTGSSPASLPLLLYFAVLVVNTFFSVRVFAYITPVNVVQMIFDGVLILIYAVLAFSFGSVEQFALVSAALFFVATFKYVHLNRIVSYPYLLHRKMKIEPWGVVASLVVIVIAWLGYPAQAAWAFFVGFALCNVYLLIFKPMYRLTP